MFKRITRSIFCLIVLAWGSGCSNATTIFPTPTFTGQDNITPLIQPGSQGTHSASSPPPSSSLSSLIGPITSDPAAYVGTQVEIIGYFRGWDLLKEVQSASPVTRSDWVIADSSGAIYVTGALPPNLDPASPNDTNKLVRLVAIVQQNQTGAYLQAVSVEVLPEE